MSGLDNIDLRDILESLRDTSSPSKYHDGASSHGVWSYNIADGVLRF